MNIDKNNQFIKHFDNSICSYKNNIDIEIYYEFGVWQNSLLGNLAYLDTNRRLDG